MTSPTGNAGDARSHGTARVTAGRDPSAELEHPPLLSSAKGDADHINMEGSIGDGSAPGATLAPSTSLPPVGRLSANHDRGIGPGVWRTMKASLRAVVLLLRPASIFVLAGSLLTLLALSACSSPPPEKDVDMTPEQARASLTALIDRSIETLGGGHWSTFESGGTDCETAGHHAGVQVDLQWFGAGAPDVEEALKKIERLWSSEGITTKRKMLGKTLAKQLIHFTDERGFFVQFTVSERAMSFWGASVCAPDDADDFNANSGS